MKKLNKTNPRLIKLVENLRSKGYKDSVNLWVDISKRLCRSTRKMPEVNLWKLDMHTKDGDVVVVPGKVLGDGNLGHKITVSALKFSKKAAALLLASIEKSQALSIEITSFSSLVKSDFFVISAIISFTKSSGNFDFISSCIFFISSTENLSFDLRISFILSRR